MAMVIIMAMLINTAMIYSYRVGVNLVHLANGIHEAPKGCLSSYVRRRGDDVVALTAMRAPLHHDGRYVQLLGRFVGICSNPTCVMR